MRYRLLGLGSLAVAAAVWMACSGDQNNTGTSIGAEGQACLPGFQCIAGFDCENNICVVPKGGDDKGLEAGVQATGNKDASPNDCENIGQAPQPLCPTPDAGDALCTDTQRFCCPGQGCQTGNDSCSAPQGHFECFATSQCSSVSNGHCCLTIPNASDGGVGSIGPGGACQSSSIDTLNAGSACSGGANTLCTEFDIELCQSQADCPANAPCTPIELDFKGVDGTPYTKTVSYCKVPPPVPDGGADGG